MKIGEQYFHRQIGSKCTIIGFVGKTSERDGIVHFKPENGNHGFLAAEDFQRRFEILPSEFCDVHPDDIAVDRFAAAMKAKLAAKRAEGRGGWEDRDACSNTTLTSLLRNHVEKGDPVDVGNLAMMIHQRGEAIGPGGTPDPDTFTAYYRNWRGEVERRWLIPIRVWFGSTDWHPEPQWLLTAWDCNRGAERDFALADFHPGSHDGRMMGERAS